MAVTALALVAVASVETAFAKKNKVIATVDGKRYKWKGRYVLASFSGNGTIIVATKPGKTIRTIGFGCAIYPPNETFPVTPPGFACNASYTVTTNRGSSITGWLATQDVQVTYDSFGDGRIGGSFSGVLDALGTGEPPVTIEGTFNTRIVQSE